MGHWRVFTGCRMNLAAHPVSQNARWPQGTHAYTGAAERQMTQVAPAGSGAAGVDAGWAGASVAESVGGTRNAGYCGDTRT